MIFSNKVFDVLKWIALVVLPASASLLIGIGEVWGIGIMPQIAQTITVVDAFLGALLGVSTIQYNRSQKDE